MGPEKIKVAEGEDIPLGWTRLKIVCALATLISSKNGTIISKILESNILTTCVVK